MTTPPPTVAIILVNWNGLGDTLECLGSLSGVTYPAVHVVVVDNGSTADEAGAIRAAYPAGGLLPVEVLETGANLGFTGGNNVGIGWALEQGAEYVLCLNNDTVVDPGFLEPLVQALQDEPNVGIVGPKIFHFSNPCQVWFLGAECTFDDVSVRRGGPAWHPPYSEREHWTQPFETQIVTGCALLIRASLMKTLGGFDDRYFAYFEDVDLNLRVEKMGLRRMVVPESHVWHKISQSSEGGRSKNIDYYGARNAIVLTQTHALVHERKEYVRKHCKQRSMDAWGRIKHQVPTFDDKAFAQAILSGLLCAHLGLYHRRQSHPVVEAAVAQAIRVADRIYTIRRCVRRTALFAFLKKHVRPSHSSWTADKVSNR